MKLCPQCEFIYEDDQSFCDMDGRELVYDPTRPLAFEETVQSAYPQLQEFAAIPAIAAGLSVSPPTRWQSRSSAVAALAAIILAVLLFVVYYARTHQARSGNANPAVSQIPVQPSAQSAQPTSGAQEPTQDLASASPELPATPELSPAVPAETSRGQSSLSVSPPSLSRGRLNNPVSARSSAGSSTSAIVWLKNGASIKADEAWEKREGIWYRQAGMVTFLKRSQVIAVQRLEPSKLPVKATAPNAEDKNRIPQNVIAQNRPSVVRPELDSSNRDSKVTSFLKKTGRILKKPFKF